MPYILALSGFTGILSGPSREKFENPWCNAWPYKGGGGWGGHVKHRIPLIGDLRIILPYAVYTSIIFHVQI